MNSHCHLGAIWWLVVVLQLHQEFKNGELYTDCQPPALSDKCVYMAVHSFNVIIIYIFICADWCSPGGYNPVHHCVKLVVNTLLRRKLVDGRWKMIIQHCSSSPPEPECEKSFESDQAPSNSDLPSHRDESTRGGSTGREGQMEAKIETGRRWVGGELTLNLLSEQIFREGITAVIL